MTLIQIFKEKKVNIEKSITSLCFDDVNKYTIFSTDAAFSEIKTVEQLFHHVAKYCKGIYDYQAFDIMSKLQNVQQQLKN